MEILSGIPEEVAEGAKMEMLARFNKLAEGAMDRQRSIAADNARADLAAVDGIGEQVMSVDAQIFHFWNWKLPGCWKDKEFRTWFMKNFPETVVKCKGSRRTTILMPGLRKS